MDNTIDVSFKQLKKELEYVEYSVKEFPGYILKFLSYGQIDGQRGSKFKRQRIHYALFQRYTKDGPLIIMTAAPHLLNIPGEAKVELLQNHIIITSMVDPSEKLTLVRLTLKY